MPLVFFSPVVTSKPTSMFPNADFALFPLENPGLISIPLCFLLCWNGSLVSGEEETAGDEKYAELEVRSLTGFGAH